MGSGWINSNIGRTKTVNIPNNSDLNSYCTPGIFGVSTTNTAVTISNCPVRVAFLLEVLLLQKAESGNWIVGIQRLTVYTGADVYIRKISTNGTGT